MKKIVAIVGIIVLSFAIVTAVRADDEKMEVFELQTNHSKKCLGESKKAFGESLKGDLSCECVDTCYDSVETAEDNEVCIIAEERCGE